MKDMPRESSLGLDKGFGWQRMMVKKKMVSGMMVEGWREEKKKGDRMMVRVKEKLGLLL